MAALIYLDTHVVVWLFAGKLELLSSLARSLIEANPIYISPMVSLELQYLYETDRINTRAVEIVDALARDIELRTCDLPFAEVVRMAWSQSWTRDPFDRIIVSQARLRGVPLLTKDATIRRKYAEALWSRSR